MTLGIELDESMKAFSEERLKLPLMVHRVRPAMMFPMPIAKDSKGRGWYLRLIAKFSMERVSRKPMITIGIAFVN
eukprot:29675_5